MTKNRIKQIETVNETYLILQKKFILFFWCTLSYPISDKPVKFKNIKEIYKWLDYNEVKPKERIVLEF